MLSAAQMLDELMGRDRNLAPTEKRREVHWEDPEVKTFTIALIFKHARFISQIKFIYATTETQINRIVHTTLHCSKDSPVAFKSLCAGVSHGAGKP